MMLVELDGHRWLSDIGFGASPLAPIELVEGPAGNEVTVEGWAFWLRRQEVTPGADGWALHHGDGHGGWVLRHNFTENPQYPVDYELANHYVATGGHSRSTAAPSSSASAPAASTSSTPCTWTRTGPAHPEPYAKRELEPYELPRLLLDTFGIELSPEEAELLMGHESVSGG